MITLTTDIYVLYKQVKRGREDRNIEASNKKGHRVLERQSD